MSWFSSKDTSGQQNFFPITSSSSGFGPLSEKDTEWACATNRGFQTETYTFYSVLGDGSLLLCQVIWSYLGIMFVPATTQMTFKLWNPHTKSGTWKSVNVGGFKPNGRSCKSDAFEIKHSGSPTTEEKYDITANLDKAVQVSVTFTRPANAPGFKLGEGPQGGISTFGVSQDDSKRDGFVMHRFHPIMRSSGSVIINGQVVDAVGDGMFVYAIQGMRPDSLASRWNFGFFTSGGGNEAGELGSVRAIQMEFETTDAYGLKGAKSGRSKVNIGCIYSTSTPAQALLVTGQTTPSPFAPSASGDGTSSATHSNPIKDKDTSYEAPSSIDFNWSGTRRDGQGSISASVHAEQGIVVNTNGLMEKVNVLAEIPAIIRKGLSAATGTKPYIYQYLNAATLEVKLDDKAIPVKGWLFNEASFVSP